MTDFSQNASARPSRKPRRWWLLLAAIAAAAVVYGLVRFDVLGFSAKTALRDALEQRGRVAVVSDADLMTIAPPGTELVPVERLSALRSALAGHDGAAVARAMELDGVQALWVDPASQAARTRTRAGSVQAQLARYAHVDGLRGLYVSRRAALYARDPFDALSAVDRQAVAGVARGLLEGARSPRVASFPEALRRVQPVEVMVLLLDRGKPRLWRSARGSSLARALVTAATVARQRWIEREQAMGGPLDAALPRLTVEVSLLGDDGTFGERDAAFLERALSPAHGVGYEDKGAWRYLLPDATREKGAGRASRAYASLFAEDGLPETSLARKELRLYRLFVSTLATSESKLPQGDGVSTVRKPDELLTPPNAAVNGQ